MKVCASCGEEKPLSEFRKYYGGRQGVYRHCKRCESIESRRRYLLKKEVLTPAQQDELNKIEHLYELRKDAGLMKPFSHPVINDINEQLAKLKEAH